MLARENAYWSSVPQPFFFSAYGATDQSLNFSQLATYNPSDSNSLFINPGFRQAGEPDALNAALAGASTDSLPYTFDIDSASRLAANTTGARLYRPCDKDIALEALFYRDSASTRRLYARIRNGDNSTRSGLGLAWSLDGEQSGIITFPPLLAGQVDSILLTSTRVHTNGAVAAQAYLTGPSLLEDCTRENDTARLADLPNRLCGNYTVGGPGANFSTLYNALHHLYSYGIACPVVLRLNPGEHPVSFGLDSCPGLTTTNTLRIEAANGDSSTCWLVPRPTHLGTTYSFGTANPHNFAPEGVHFSRLSFMRFTLEGHIGQGSFTGCRFEDTTVRGHLGEVSFRRCTVAGSLMLDSTTRLSGLPARDINEDSTRFIKCIITDEITLLPIKVPSFQSGRKRAGLCCI